MKYVPWTRSRRWSIRYNAFKRQDYTLTADRLGKSALLINTGVIFAPAEPIGRREPTLS